MNKIFQNMTSIITIVAIIITTIILLCVFATSVQNKKIHQDFCEENGFEITNTKTSFYGYCEKREGATKQTMRFVCEPSQIYVIGTIGQCNFEKNEVEKNG